MRYDMSTFTLVIVYLVEVETRTEKLEWQRRQYVRSAVAYDALSGPCACRGDSQGWRSTLRFTHVEMGWAA